jgi:Ras-related protein Rab-7A
MANRPVLKIIVLGDSGVGKTCLLKQYVQRKFEPRYKATIGAEFLSKDISIDGVDVKVSIWDTAGQDRFQSLGTAFYRGADACVLVYDVTSTDSFSHLTSWMEEFSLQAKKNEFVLIGNKTDLGDKRTVTARTAQAWCQKNGDIKYFETSAKDNTGVDEAFIHVATQAFKKKARAEEEDVVPKGKVDLGKSNQQKKKDDGCPC